MEMLSNEGEGNKTRSRELFHIWVIAIFSDHMTSISVKLAVDLLRMKGHRTSQWKFYCYYGPGWGDIQIVIMQKVVGTNSQNRLSSSLRD